MSGTSSRRMRQGATLSLVFGAVLATGAATGAWGQSAGPAPRHGVAAYAAAVDPAGRDLTPAEARRLVGESGDRWAAYYSPGEYADFAQSLDGAYVGVGLWVRREQDGVAVSRVQQGTPAARAGIRAGDRLLRIDGAPADRMPVTEVVARLRGTGDGDGGDGDGGDDDGGPGGGDRASREAPDGRATPLTGGGAEAGSTVTLAVRSGSSPVREVTLRRTVLATQDVTVDHPGPDVTRIAVAAFTSGVGAEVADALHTAARRRAADGARHGGVVLDLRGNSGGLLAEAVAAASAFLDGGPVGTYQVRGVDRELTAEPGGDTATPLVVLVDSGTMSAAELLAGALQDRCRAVVVGSRTFGKGTVQEPSRLADGSVLELTVGRYYTPAGRSPDGTGIVPDVSVPARSGPAQAEQLALTVLSGLGGGRSEPSRP
ncbi:S41 family peptidase [Streptomyces sp. NPDC092296]|uniref:S41 family peptidase n=1 Tax=Streptomyces sp. NPDC092296 TaxID=3366012 RepID=UPI003804C6E8